MKTASAQPHPDRVARFLAEVVSGMRRVSCREFRLRCWHEVGGSPWGTRAISADALEMAEDNEPDVILLDLAMPEKSGLDVLHELKSSKPTRDIPVIVVSAYAMLMMGSDARRADGVIQKPFDLADLLLQVEQAAAKRRQRSRQKR